MSSAYNRETDMKRSTLILAAAAFAATPLMWGEAHAQTDITECMVISEPGSYRVVNNLAWVAFAPACLEVTVPGVIIDLNGFQIDGSGSEGAAGVLSNAAYNPTPYNVTVRNGSVTNFTLGNGILLVGQGIVEGVFAYGNGIGIGVGGGSIVTGNTATDNTSMGIYAPVSTVKGNVASGNGGDGINSVGGPGSSLTDNITSFNGGDGIEVTCPSVLIGNASTENTEAELNLVKKGTASCISVNNAVYQSAQ